MFRPPRSYEYERQDWFGSTIGHGGRRRFGGALAEGWEGVGEKPHFSQRTREMGHPASWSGATLNVVGKTNESKIEAP
jgi:hypothetical protein